MGRDDGGRFFGSYHLLDEIGRGGAAVVYRARHVHPAYAETLFAIKRLLPGRETPPEVVARFRREGYALSMLAHPNIVRTFEFGVEGEELFIASELVDGHDLAGLLARLGGLVLPTYLATYLVNELLAGLACAHQLRDSGGKAMHVVHRDVKPSNVLIAYDGQVKLTDFGIAVVTGTPSLDDDETVVGTVGYIAPEVFTGESEGDARADLFAVGAILYELACGVSPFGVERTSRIVRRNVDAVLAPPRSINPDLSAELEAVLLRALARRPEDRFASAREMARALQPFVPARAGMPLIIGSLLRGLFLTDFGGVQGSAHRLRDAPPVRASSRVAVHVPGVKGLALREELERLDLAVEQHLSTETLVTALASDEPPGVILTDVASASFLPDDFAQVLRRGPRIVPVLAVADSIEPEPARTADAIGALDLLVPPFKPKRLLAALRSALAGDPGAAERELALTAIEIAWRVRIVTADYALAARLSGSFAEWGYAVDVSPTREEAIERTLSASPHGVIYDLGADPQPDPEFALRFRKCPGMGLVPVVYLTAADAPLPHLPERCAVRARTDADVAIAATLNTLRTTVHLGRTFTRYPAPLQLELCYGGRAYRAEGIDLSRGGALVRCGKTPAVGRDVRLVFRLHDLKVELPGKVVRIQLPERDEGPALAGIAFKPATPDVEEPLIAYVVALDHFR